MGNASHLGCPVMTNETLPAVPLRKGLYRMSEGMSQIQLPALAFLELIARHNTSLHLSCC